MSREPAPSDSADNPLLELPSDKQEELIAAWEDYQESNDTTNVRRRGFLQAGAAVLTGTAIGGGAYALSSEEVAAAANEVGQIGESGNLVDVYADDVSAVSVATNELTGDWPERVTVFAEGSVQTTIDPASTTTPIQDAVDVLISLNDGIGRVVVPPATIQEAGSVTGVGKAIDLIGYGTEVSVIEFTDTGVDGLKVDGGSTNAFGSQSKIDGVTLDGTDKATRKGNGTAAIRWTEGGRQFNMGAVQFTGWGDVITIDGGAQENPSDSFWQALDFGYSVNSGHNIGPGANGGSGPPVKIGVMSCGTSDATGVDAIINNDGMDLPLEVGVANQGGEPVPFYRQTGGAGSHIHRLGWEPATDPGSGSIIETNGLSFLKVDHVKNFRTVDSVYTIIPGGGATDKIFGPVRMSGSVNVGVLDVQDDTRADGFRYEGPTSDVNNSSGGALTGPVYCWDGNVT